MTDPEDASGNSLTVEHRARRGGLGRGLDALIPSGGADDRASGVKLVPIDSIQANPYQPRARLHESDLESLTDSIRTHGLLQPVVVMLADIPGQYVLIAGERRWRASRRAGLRDVPVVIKDVSPQEMLELALVENVIRANLSSIEEANAYRQLIEEFGLTQAEVAVRVSKSRVTVTNTLRLLSAPEAVQEAVQSGAISEGHARALLGLPSGVDQLAMLDVVVGRGLSVRQTEEEVRRFLKPRPPVSRQRSDTGENYQQEALEVARALGAPVNILMKRGSSSGAIEIVFHDQEELNRLIRLLGKEEPLF